MQRRVVGIGTVAVLVAVWTAAGPLVLGADDHELKKATVVAEAGSYWVRDGAGLPVLVAPDAENRLHLPQLVGANLLVLDESTARPITKGNLRWLVPGIPAELTQTAWSARHGKLDLACRGGEQVMLLVDGYRPSTITLGADDRRHTVLLEPHGDLELRVQPPAAGRLWLAPRRAITGITPFFAAASRYDIGDDGTVVVPGLDGVAEHEGVIVVPGWAPVTGQIQGLPRRLEIELDAGLGLSGQVVDDQGQALPRARVRARGTIDTLGKFRYTQETRTDSEGGFSVGGLLVGEIMVTACAENHACAETTIALDPAEAAKPIVLQLAPGHDLRLVIQDEYGRAVADAVVFDFGAYRTHRADDQGVVVFKGVEPGGAFDLEVAGTGLQPWRGAVATDLPEVVLRIPRGGVLEWPILTDRVIAAAEVVASWSRLNGQGREIDTGFAVWDAERRLLRADGLEPGPHHLKLRLPGRATMLSETVEIGPGDELQLAAGIPDYGLAISGRVLDGATYRPLAGARVSCEPGSPHQFRKPHELERLPTTLSDADGVFLLEGLDPTSCRAVVRAPGFAAWRKDGVEPEEAGADLGDIELDLGVTMVGQVVDRAGRGLTGVVVEITETAAYAYFAETSVRTDHEGWFRAETVPTGRWTLSAEHGGQRVRATVEGRAGETVTAELRLGGVRLEGEVWIGDRPAAGGDLVLTTGGGRVDGVVVMVRTGADQRRLFGVDQPPVSIPVAHDGRFVAVGIEPGAYTASYTPPAAGSLPVGRELVIPQTETHRCVVRFSDAGVEGVVVDDRGLPVTGAAVTVQAADGRPIARGFSDGEGLFSFVGLDAGVIRVGAVHGELTDSEPVEVELRAGDRAGPLTLELGPPEGAELGVAVHSAGGSLTGAPVYLVGADTMTGFTDGQGVASFAGIDPGRYRPCAAAYGGAVGCGSEIELANGENRTIDLELGHGGWVDVLLGPVERTPSFRVMTADGIDLTSLLMMVSPPQPGPRGIRIGPLRPDDYRIVVSRAGVTREGVAGTVEQDTVELDLR